MLHITSLVALVCKINSALIGSINILKMVKSLCVSQKYHRMIFFLAFICNQKGHFRMKQLKACIY